MRVFDFLCPKCNRVEEKFVESWDSEGICRICEGPEIKLISSLNFKLDGTDPAYPTEWDRWARIHEQEAKREASS